ncbi:MAG: LysR family transcriptional regulator [Myxococcales bacterium]|nr:LysR family transcriptional regulator [Myxococcales bacterium]
MRDDLSGLRALLCVAEKRSFRAAAADLGVTPSAVSQIVRALEERVGVRLLQRTTRNVGLTEAGEHFIAQLKPAFHAVDVAFESLAAMRGRPSGLLRLTMLRTGYADVIKPKLARFLAAYPDIRLEICLEEALSNIVAEGFDAGIRLGHSLDREMIAVRVSPDQRLVAVGSPSYFAKAGRPTHPRDLQNHECIGLRMSSGVVARWRFVDGEKDLELAVGGRVVTNDGSVLVDAALAGVGVAYVFEDMVSDLVAEKRLVRVLEPYCPKIPGYFLYYPTKLNLAPKLKALIDFLKDDGRSRSRRQR